MFQKKHLLIIKKDEVKAEKAIKMEQSKAKLANKYQDKVQSKLFVETKTLQDKKRTKFNPETDSRADAMTMGGKLPM